VTLDEELRSRRDISVHRRATRRVDLSVEGDITLDDLDELVQRARSAGLSGGAKLRRLQLNRNRRSELALIEEVTVPEPESKLTITVNGRPDLSTEEQAELLRRSVRRLGGR
jgi:hypothetical protein